MALKNVQWNLEWVTVIFLDEKIYLTLSRWVWRITGMIYGTRRKLFISNHSGGGSIIIWGVRGPSGKTDIAFIKNQLIYQSTLNFKKKICSHKVILYIMNLSCSCRKIKPFSDRKFSRNGLQREIYPSLIEHSSTRTLTQFKTFGRC